MAGHPVQDYGDLADEAATQQVLQTILRIKRKDPSVYDPTTTFFDDKEKDGG